MGEISLINQPVLLDRTPGSIKVAPPERGNDTKDILLELGIDEKDIDRMHKAVSYTHLTLPTIYSV